MAAKSQDFATRFDTKAQDAVALLRHVSDADWKKVTEAETWSVGVTAHHLAGSLDVVAGMITAIAAGRASGVDFTTATLDELNAKHAVEHADCTRAETIALLERGAAAASTVVRGLSDDDLARVGTVFTDPPPMSVEQLIRAGLFGHMDEHIGSIRKTIGAHPTPTPQAEHEWLQQLLGEWTSEAETEMEPGKPPVTCQGTESVRSLGGLWIVAEGQGEMPGGGHAGTIMTLGYDPAKKRYVGTFVASMMTHLWPYDGALDASGRRLVLDSEGPSMAGDGTIAKYQDVIEIEGADRRTLTAYARGEDGAWKKFMTATYRRKPAR